MTKRTDQRAEVLSAHVEKAQRVVSLWQAQATTPTPVELMRGLPVEDERLLANKDLLNPSAWAHDAVSDVVRDVTDGPALTGAGKGPLLGGERPEEFFESAEPVEELVCERSRTIAHVLAMTVAYQWSRRMTSSAGRRVTGPKRPRGHPTGMTA
jgi:hypothetical protein